MPLSPAEQAEYDLLTQFVDADRERAACEGSLFEFFKRAWREIDPAPFEENWHHHAIAEQLEDLARGGTRDIVCNIPPRAGKTNLITVCFPAWVWTLKRNDVYPLMGAHCSFLCVSYGAVLAEVAAVKMRRLVMGDWYQKLWGNRVTIRDDQASRSDFGNTSGGERISTSIEGGILGRGALIQIIDDPHKLDAVESDVERSRTLRAIKEGLTTRITDPRISARILVMQRLHCLLPGTLVRTPAGQTPVEELTADSQVLGSEGWQKVRATSAMPFNGDAYGVRLFGHPEVCWTTPNHRYLTKRGWQRADDLLSDDWVRFPVADTTRSETIPWGEPRRADPPASPTGSFTGADASGIARDDLTILVARGLTNTAIANRLGVHRNTVQCYLWLYQIGRIRENTPWFGREHLDDPMFWRVVGYWLAEGCFMKGRGTECGVRFTFHTKETDYIGDIETTLARYGLPTTKRYPGTAAVCQMEANSSQFARWLKENFGSGARAKVIPEFVFTLSAPLREEILEGWLRGDGCVRQTGSLAGQRSGTSSSVALIQGMQRIAHSIGRRAIIVRGVAEARERQILKWRGIVSQSWELRLSPEPRREGSMRSKIEAGAVWHQIRHIEMKPYDGMVYDITTQSRDFVVGNATIHNTDDATEYALANWRPDLRHIILPMRFDPSRACFCDPRTELGELLWPDVWTEEAVHREEAELGPYGAAGQLAQMPTPRGGGIIKLDWIEPWPPLNTDGTFPEDMIDPRGRIRYPAFEYIVACVDTAFTKKQTADRSAMAVIGVFRAEGKGRIERRPDGRFTRVADDYGFPKAMLIHGWAKQLDLHGPNEEMPSDMTAKEWNSPAVKARRRETWGLVEWVADTCANYKVDYLNILTLGQGHGLEQELRRLHHDNEWTVGMEVERGDKLARAYRMQHLFSARQVFAPQYEDGTYPTWCDPLIRELVTFPMGRNDDFVDAIMGALRHLREIGMMERRDEFEREEAHAMSWEANRRVPYPYQT